MSTRFRSWSSAASSAGARALCGPPSTRVVAGSHGRQARQHHLRRRSLSVPGLVPAADALRTGCPHGLHGRAACRHAERPHDRSVPWDELRRLLFRRSIECLRREGFRVVVPDQIGFGRSSKPVIPYNFHDMAANTRKLLQTLGVTRATIFGHSMGGMLAARFAASYPDVTERSSSTTRSALPTCAGSALAHCRRGIQSHAVADPRPAVPGILGQHPSVFPECLEAGVRAVRPHSVRADS